MIWEAGLSRIGGCKLPRGYGGTKPFELSPFNKKNITRRVTLMRKTHAVTQKASDIENLKGVMITFVSNALSLSQREEKALISHSTELPQQATLSDLIAHLTEKNVELGVVQKLKDFGKNDAVV